MQITKKTIIDDIVDIATRFGHTDDDRFNYMENEWLSYKIDQVRADLIIQEFENDGVIDRSWLSQLSPVSVYPVNFADDPNVSYCNCEISKFTLPSIISLSNRKNGNEDLGLYSLMSMCGRTKYYFWALGWWQNIPADHPRAKFHYYDRIGNDYYVNKQGIESLRPLVILANPEDAVVKNSAPVVSGAIQTGISYTVKGSQVTYNGTVYNINSTFTGVVGVTSYTGNGYLVLTDQMRAYTENDPYPVSPDMARNIAFEILTKELQIEKQQIQDIRNDSKDDIQKVQDPTS